jgi:hypothetical protein
MISDFTEKKLVEYLQDGQKVLIRFGHGLGDTIMFMPIFYRLQELYPKIHFDLYVECGQEQIWKSIKDKDAEGYDLVFSPVFPMSEGTNYTKAELCCITEIGIEPFTELSRLPYRESPLVAVHFNGTALPESVGCPEETAREIWQEIKDAGLIPIECHFKHIWHNPVNEKYSFVDNSVREYKADLDNLIGLLNHCRAFIGVASGPFVVAMSIMPNSTLLLEKHHKLENYTHLPIKRVDIINYQKGGIKCFLNEL